MRFRLLSIVSLLLGIALFVYLLRQTGTAEILARVRALGMGFLLLLALSAVRHLVRAYAWLRCMGDDDRSVGLGAVLRARLAGEALADLTAAGPALGEPIKLAHLRGRVRLASLASSLAVENLTYAISSGLLVVSGLLTLLAVFVIGDQLRLVSWVAILLVSLTLVGLLLGLARRWPLASMLWTAVVGGFPRFAPLLPKLRELETNVFAFYHQRRGDFLVVACCNFLFHLAGVVEIYVTLQLIGVSATFVTAFILEAANRVINIVFAFVPAMIGVDEAGTGLLAQALGLGTSTGVTLAIIRKARMLVWIAVGLFFLAIGPAAKPLHKNDGL